MSVSAMAWVSEQDIRPATAKFVLFALANNVDENGFAWPSVKYLCRFTSQDRKTVLASVARLEEMGWLVDSGQRRGRTNQVKVYRLNGLPTGKVHYVYRLIDQETGSYYIGVRTTWFDAEGDTDYQGSGNWPNKMRRSGIQLVKEVIGTFPSRAAAESFESQEIRKCFEDPRCMNDKNGRVPKTEPFRSSHETVPNFPGNSTVPPANSPKFGTRIQQGSVNEPLFENKNMAAKAAEYASEFAVITRDYPKRQGDNPFNQALKHYIARRKEGHSFEQLRQGVGRYMAYCKTRGDIGTEFVMQAKRFFGTDKPFMNTWDVKQRSTISGGPSFDDLRHNDPTSEATRERATAIDTPATRQG